MELSFGLQMVWVLASQEAIVAKFEHIEGEQLFIALLKFSELKQNQLQVLGQMPGITSILSEEKKSLSSNLAHYGIKVPEYSKPLRRLLRKNMGYGHYLSIGRKKIHRSNKAKEVFLKAEEYGKSEKSETVTSLHLLKAILAFSSPVIKRTIKELGINLSKVPQIIKPVEMKRKDEEERFSKNPFVNLICKLKKLRSDLLSKVTGQSHAIHLFIEGLYDYELVKKIDDKRKRPLGVFIFAGPPGVGKTYLGELSASYLKRPFKKFDMTAYSISHQSELLIGTVPIYKSAQAGYLTEFVLKNPNSVLLFDEIEKAHINTIQLFYQILDSGVLEDKFLKKEVCFKDTIIIFTTNAGKSLYNNPNRIGISAANSNYHKRTIMSALASETNPSTGKHIFPQPLCSRLSQGYPVMFNHLGINELEIICENALVNTEKMLSKEYKKEFIHDNLLPLSIILREGGKTDARQIKAEAEKLIKRELFNFSCLYETKNLEDAMNSFGRISFEIDRDSYNSNSDIKNIFESSEKPGILLIGDSNLVKIYTKYITEIKWFTADTLEDAKDTLSTEDINLILLDLWLKKENIQPGEKPLTNIDSINKRHDFIPLSSKDLDEGRNILQKLHKQSPEIPVYLLSINSVSSKADEKNSQDEMTTIIGTDIGSDSSWDINFERSSHKIIDEELFIACVRSGGARGLIKTNFADISGGKDWLLRRNQFANALIEINRNIFREKEAKKLTKEHRALSFTASPILDKEKKTLLIRIRNFFLTSSIDSSDVGSVLEDIERPQINFKNVIGATEAKSSLQFVVNWLKKPLYYRSMGVRPPKGILLTGPPGTGKTMIARATAGESSCAFIETSATGFITIWQGSGPQNIRNLFIRARRYAPSIIFIDEIDAIGKKRSGSPGGSARSEEATLNALLTEMDGFCNISAEPVIVLAATNLEETLDPALKRRFDRIIPVERPDKNARLTYLNKALSNRKISRVNIAIINRIAGQSAGMTIADLERIIQEAAIIAVHKNKSLTDQILEEAFEKIRMGAEKKLPDQNTLTRIARHESGHAIIEWVTDSIPVQVTIVGRGSAGGYVESEFKEDQIIHTKDDIEKIICKLMGGRAAELIYYGGELGLSTGASNDLKEATKLAVMMVTKYGMNNDFGLFHFDKSRHGYNSIEMKVYMCAEKIVADQLLNAKKILVKQKKSMDLLALKLMEKNRLTQEDLKEILAKKL